MPQCPTPTFLKDAMRTGLRSRSERYTCGLTTRQPSELRRPATHSRVGSAKHTNSWHECANTILPCGFRACTRCCLCVADKTSANTSTRFNGPACPSDGKLLVLTSEIG